MIRDSQPLISVLIPVYNAEKYISKSLRSIVDQSYSNIEICICNDASTDQSEEIIKSFSDSRIKAMSNELNIGYLRTINKLMSVARGGFFAFQDADDISHYQRLELQLKFLTENAEISLAGANFNVVDPAGIVVHANQKVESDPLKIKQQLAVSNPFQKPSIMFHRKIYDEIGGFREGFLKLKNISEDYDWLMRASEKFLFSNVNHETALYSYRSVSTAMTKNYQNVEQTFGSKIVQDLARQRKSTGTDCLQQEDWPALARLIESYKIPYQLDRSLFYFEKAEALIYAGLYNQALHSAWKAFTIHPFKRRNLKCLASSIKKKIKTVYGWV